MTKIDTYAAVSAVKRLSGSGRSRTAYTADNVDVEELVMSRGKSTQTHRTILSINFNKIASF